MTTDDDLAAMLEQAAAELRQRRPAPPHWIEAFRAGHILTVTDAGKIAERDGETIRRWCEAANTDQPMGYSTGRLWLVDALALLDQIEAREGLPARLAADSRLRKHLADRSQAPQTLVNLPVAATA